MEEEYLVLTVWCFLSSHANLREAGGGDNQLVERRRSVSLYVGEILPSPGLNTLIPPEGCHNITTVIQYYYDNHIPSSHI